jgi:hypothetical protein
MATLYQMFLPLVQSLNDYGGNFTAPHIREAVLDAVDEGAAAKDQSFVALRAKLSQKMTQWKGLQDHETFSALFEAYYEAVFYLIALQCGVSLRPIPARTGKGKTPDFETTREPTLNFEVKTLDVADPGATYDDTMAEGLDLKLQAEAQARRTGVGSTVRSIRPHGAADDWSEVIAQVMRKIDSNVKAGQFASVPTFLVVSLARTAVHGRVEDLRKWLPGPEHDASGQLFAIAAQKLEEPFYFYSQRRNDIASRGELGRAGILLDHPYIVGLIFLHTEWNGRNSTNSVDEVYALNGIWNKAWEKGVGPAQAAAAKALFEQICHAWNDTEDSRSPLLPTH